MREMEGEQSDLGASVGEGEARDIDIADCIFQVSRIGGSKARTHAVEEEVMETVFGGRG